jgi:hypothetical protein
MHAEAILLGTLLQCLAQICTYEIERFFALKSVKKVKGQAALIEPKEQLFGPGSIAIA